jgi:DNA polymerase
VSEDAQRRRDVAEVAGEAARHLRWLADAGVAEAPPPALASRDRGSGPPGPNPLEPPPAHPGGGRAGACEALAPESRADPPQRSSGGDALRSIRDEIGDCRRCKLAAGRTQVVFGVGSPRAEVMFVGEGPGADEDRQGEPFVGKAGQLLTKMIEAMGYGREDVYIANVVKCRPPGNRNPEPDEIDACEPFLRAQIAAVGPKVVVALGKFAAQTLLRETTPISRLRGRWFEYGGAKLMPTFHPAYLLRSPEEKKKAWEDLKVVMAELGRPLARR